MKYFIPIVAITTLLASCSKKESTRCYQCYYTNENGNKSAKYDLCDQTDKQIKEYMKANTITKWTVINGDSFQTGYIKQTVCN